MIKQDMGDSLNVASGTLAAEEVAKSNVQQSAVTSQPSGNQQ